MAPALLKTIRNGGGMAGRVLKNLETQGLVSASGKTIVVFGTR